MLQTWIDLTFVHWRIQPDRLRDLIAPGLDVDTFDGDGFVSFIPFRITGARAPFLPPLPGLSAFHEWNLRTYVVHKGVPGIWFFSLEASNLPAVLGARATYKLPYHYARMKKQSGDGRQRYSSSRIWPHPPAGASICECTHETVFQPAQPRTLEFWLAERYLLYSYGRGRLSSARVHHKPYELTTAKIHSLELDILRAEGLDGIGAPMAEAQFARAVEVEIFALKSLN